MDKHAFLSDEWVAACRELRQEFQDEAPSNIKPVKINLVIEKVPFGEGKVDAHLDTSSGQPEVELEHLPKADATITTDYATAKGLIVEGRMSQALEAMQLGRIKVKGNMFKLFGLSKLGNESEALTERIREITA